MLEMKPLNFTFRSDSIRGFTLIELMTAIVIIGVLALFATPSFIDIKRNSELTSATNNLMAAINTARTEAMKQGKNAVIAPIVAGNWDAGIRVFVDNNMDSAYDAGDLIIKDTEILPNYFTVTHTPNNAADDYSLFNGSGYARTMTKSFNSTFQIARNDIADPVELLSQTRRIKIALTGRVRSCKPASSTDPQCLSTTSGVD
jgi:type IV fimbrial biogenesis protein FimT